MLIIMRNAIHTTYKLYYKNKLMSTSLKKMKKKTHVTIRTMLMSTLKTLSG